MSSESSAPAVDLARHVTGVAERDPANYPVDGRVPRWAFAPASLEETTEVVTAARAAGLVVVPWGGGTQMGLGNLPETVDVALDLRGLNEVLVYEPDDLTLAVQPGRTLGDINRQLVEHQQVLPVDTADPDRATIGGLVACGASGPRRFGYGALRDLIIGITVLSPEGRSSQGGGMVVKNVSGFDMMRLHHGALGSLGVMVRVNFKVLPKPRAQQTIVARFATLEPAVRAAEAVRWSQLGPTAIVLLDAAAAAAAAAGDAPWTVALRCEAPPAAVVRQAERIAGTVAEDATAVETLDEAATEALWSGINRGLGSEPLEDAIRIRVGVQASKLAGVIPMVESIATERGLGMARTVDFGSGLAYATFQAGAGETAPLRAAWEALQGMGQHATLLTAPPEVKTETDVFGREPAGFWVMRSLKEQFDPGRVLNRGRYVGHL